MHTEMIIFKNKARVGLFIKLKLYLLVLLKLHEFIIFLLLQAQIHCNVFYTYFYNSIKITRD